jgi:hypothetical protein
VNDWLKSQGVRFAYEKVHIPFTQPKKERKYLPDFILGTGVVIETKGLFQTDDRQKHLWIKAQYPDLDLRFVFSNARARIAKKSPTTYAMWADKNGFKWAHKEVPPEWLSEPVNLPSLALVRALGLHL